VPIKKLKGKIFTRKTIIVVFIILFLEFVPSLFGGRDHLIGFYSREYYLPDQTDSYTTAKIQAQYLYLSIPVSSNLSNRLSLGRFYDLGRWFMGGELKNKSCLSNKTYDSYISYKTTGEIGKVEECWGIGIIQVKYEEPIIN